MLDGGPPASSAAAGRVASAIKSIETMGFVYLRVMWFAGWIGLGVEVLPVRAVQDDWLLEAVRLSTSVMVRQNRADSKRQIRAQGQWRTVLDEDQHNEDRREV